MWWCRFNLILNICMVYFSFRSGTWNERCLLWFRHVWALSCKLRFDQLSNINLSFYLRIIIFVGIMECNPTIFAGSPPPSPNIPPFREPIPSITIQPLFYAHHISSDIMGILFFLFHEFHVKANNHISTRRNLHVVFNISKISKTDPLIQNSLMIWG